MTDDDPELAIGLVKEKQDTPKKRKRLRVRMLGRMATLQDTHISLLSV